MSKQNEVLSVRRRAVESAIHYMHHHIYEPLSLSDIADVSAYSPFHFSRVFKQQLGVSPLYYFSTLKFQKAKELLLKTSLTIQDICLDVGLQSLGTFTTVFTKRVGLSPSSFRSSLTQFEENLESIWDIRTEEKEFIKDADSVISGTILAPESFQKGIILIGLFSKVVPEGIPRYLKLMKQPGKFQFTGIKPGIYYLKAIVITEKIKLMDIYLPQDLLGAKVEKPLIINKAFSKWERIEMVLKERKWTDRTVLISLPLLIHRYQKGQMRAI
jgi:AraC-like DNA-binding protein